MRRPHNLKKNIPSFLTKQLFSLSSVKTSGDFFKLLWPFQKSWTSMYSVAFQRWRQELDQKQNLITFEMASITLQGIRNLISKTIWENNWCNDLQMMSCSAICGGARFWCEVNVLRLLSNQNVRVYKLWQVAFKLKRKYRKLQTSCTKLIATHSLMISCDIMVAINELFCMKNAGTQIAMDFN